MSANNSELRRRNTNTNKDASSPPRVAKEKAAKREEVVWGKTPSGQVFRVPTTHGVLTLFNPAYPKSHIDILNLSLLALQILLFLILPNTVSRYFFSLYFAFWRLAYDAGLGWVLTKQSKKRWLVREVQRLGWLDEGRCPGVRAWIGRQLGGKMGKDYSFDELPLEYNTWLLFRQLVDIILLNDFVSYCLFAFSFFRIPVGYSFPVHILRWIGGLALIAFNYWVKAEAHDVVKDYGWYWGDVFFQRGALVFDGVFELAPHPMYSVGYAGYYGLSLIAGSYTVLFGSLAAHAAQFAFLVFFENPHIERMYGQRKLLASRSPLLQQQQQQLPSTGDSGMTSSTSQVDISYDPDARQEDNNDNDNNDNETDLLYTTTTMTTTTSTTTTPALTATDASASASATESEVETEEERVCGVYDPGSEQLGSGSELKRMGSRATVRDLRDLRDLRDSRGYVDRDDSADVNGFEDGNGSETRLSVAGGNGNGGMSGLRNTSSPSPSPSSSPSRPRLVSQHDLMNRYFRNDVIFLHNVDVFRAPDLLYLLLLLYTSLLLLPLSPSLSLSNNTILALHFLHALSWRLFHTFGLGLLLKAQSESKYLVRHYLQHYYYGNGRDRHGSSKGSGRGSRDGAVEEAFANWKGVYNASMCMTYLSFAGLAWKTYSFPQEWAVGEHLLKHTLGILLIGLHVWAAFESYEVLGVFGWFYGDFFIEDYPATVEYSGIYRYLNNPEIMSGASLFGITLMTGSKLVLAVAVISSLSYWWFLRNVENPHMQKLYGPSLRKEAGFTKIIKKVAVKNARLLEKRAGNFSHVPEIRRVAQEVRGSFEKVVEETAGAVEEFLSKSKPKISEVVQDTKFLLQQSRERLIITRLASDLSSYDTAKYSISVLSSRSDGKLRFHLGEQIKVDWRAPASHSRQDWIGIYRLGANKSSLVTNISSMGLWVPVHDNEWDGDIPSEPENRPTPSDSESGQVQFTGDKLPWHIGTYEIRYHHDGKYNVMSLSHPIEIYVDPPSVLNFQSVRWYLMHMVTLCLDSDPSLVPLSSKHPDSPSRFDPDERDPDDFRFWSEKQARRIALCIKQAFDLELTPELIVAEANISALTNRILVAKELLARSKN